MTYPVPGGKITAGFDQKRPLSAQAHERWHVHGAIDIAAPAGKPIYAPERGMLFYFAAIRPNRDRDMRELELEHGPFDFGGKAYFYDVFGALAIVLGNSGITHIFAHSWLNQLFNVPPVRVRWQYKESPKVERFPLCAFFTTNGHGRHINEGDHIADVGNAGYSTGPHAHYEMHRGRAWQRWEQRPRPDAFYKEAR